MAKTGGMQTVGEAARVLVLSPARVRQLADAGVLPVVRTGSGLRLFRAEDVEALRKQREGGVIWAQE